MKSIGWIELKILCQPGWEKFVILVGFCFLKDVSHTYYVVYFVLLLNYNKILVRALFQFLKIKKGYILSTMNLFIIFFFLWLHWVYTEKSNELLLVTMVSKNCMKILKYPCNQKNQRIDFIWKEKRFPDYFMKKRFFFTICVTKCSIIVMGNQCSQHLLHSWFFHIFIRLRSI